MSRKVARGPTSLPSARSSVVMSTNALGSLVAIALLTSPCTVPKASTAAATIRLALLGSRRSAHRCTTFEQCGDDALAHALRGAGDDRDVPAHRVGVSVGHLAGPICSATPR